MTKPLYDTDFYTWTQTQAAALRAKDWPALDVDNLAEEIESLGKRDRRAVESSLEVVAKHLLKWVYQPQERPRRGRSWQNSLRNARTRLRRLLRDHPGLREQLAALLAEAYPDARRGAAGETGLPLATFPESCPWPVDAMLTEDWLPPEG